LDAARQRDKFKKIIESLQLFEGIQTNYLFLGVIIFTAAVQILLVFVGGLAFNVMPLTWPLWIYSIGSGFVMLLTGFLLRLIPVPLEDWEVERDPEVIKQNLLSNELDEEETKDNNGDDDDE